MALFGTPENQPGREVDVLDHVMDGHPLKSFVRGLSSEDWLSAGALKAGSGVSEAVMSKFDPPNHTFQIAGA